MEEDPLDSLFFSPFAPLVFIPFGIAQNAGDPFAQPELKIELRQPQLPGV